MTITRSTFLYEVLARFNSAGFQGAHAIDIEQVADGTEVISEKELPARPITQAEFGDLLGGQTAALIEAADTAMEALRRVTEERDRAQAALDNLPKPAEAPTSL